MNRETIQAMRTNPAEFRKHLYIPSAHRGPQPFASVIRDFQAERFAAIDPALLAISRGEKPPISRHWWEATKGASKDTDLSVCILWLLAFCPRPLLCQVAAADEEQAGELKKAARSILQIDANAWLRDLVQLQSALLFNPHTESRCEIISSDSNSSHGARPDVLILNELTHLPAHKRDFAETLMDNASKVPHGIVVIATNSGFSGSWQEEWRDLARTSPRWFYHAYSRPAPWLDAEELDEARRRNSPSRYLRLWGGQWVGDEESALHPDDVAACTNLTGPMPCGMSGFIYVAGLDLSDKRDRTGLVLLATSLQEAAVYVARVVSWNPAYCASGRINHADVEAAIVDLHHTFGLAALIADPYQALGLLQRLNARSIRTCEAHYSPTFLDTMTTSLRNIFEERSIRLFEHEELLSDLGQLRVKELPDGRQRLTAKRTPGGHADTAVALATALPYAVQWFHETLSDQDLYNQAMSARR